MDREKQLREDKKLERDLYAILSDEENLDSFVDAFDADSDVMDDNLNQGMKISDDGKPVPQTHLE